MEFYQLEDFIAVAEARSFTQAAERVFRTQATVSLAIKKLEEEVGVLLFERDSHDCRLTEAGEVLLEHARRLIDLRKQAERMLAEFTSLSTGRVRIAAHESAARYLLPDPLATFHRRFPDIRIETRLCGVGEVAQLVADRSVDLGFGISQANLRGLRAEVVYADPLVLVVAPEHRFALSGAVAIADLGGEKFFAHHLHTTTTDAIQGLLEHQGVEFNVVAELWNFETVKQFVMAGSGIAIVPRSAAIPELATGALAVVAVDGLELTRHIEIVWRDKGPLLPAPAQLAILLRGWPWEAGWEVVRSHLNAAGRGAATASPVQPRRLTQSPRGSRRRMPPGRVRRPQ